MHYKRDYLVMFQLHISTHDLYCVISSIHQFNYYRFVLLFYNSIQVSPELKDLINRLLEKDPNQRIAISEMRSHAWITEFDNVIPSADANCSGSIDVSIEEIEGAVQNYRTPIHILVCYNIVVFICCCFYLLLFMFVDCCYLLLSVCLFVCCR